MDTFRPQKAKSGFRCYRRSVQFRRLLWKFCAQPAHPGCWIWGQPGPPRYRTCRPGVGARRPWHESGGGLASRCGPTLARIVASQRIVEDAIVSVPSRPPERPSGFRDSAWSRFASGAKTTTTAPLSGVAPPVLASGQASGGRW